MPLSRVRHKERVNDSDGRSLLPQVLGSNPVGLIRFHGGGPYIMLIKGAEKSGDGGQSVSPEYFLLLSSSFPPSLNHQDNDNQVL